MKREKEGEMLKRATFYLQYLFGILWKSCVEQKAVVMYGFNELLFQNLKPYTNIEPFKN